MLRSLIIKNVVLIEYIEIKFCDGLCVLTGETGAGKSVFLDALGLAIGERANQNLIRHGETEATVTAIFKVPSDNVTRALLTENGINLNDPDLILRRVLSSDGTSRAYINDQVVSISFLRSVGSGFVDVHGQFENQKLLKPSFHRNLLDKFGGCVATKESVSAIFYEWKELIKAKKELERQIEKTKDDEEYLVQSLEELDLLEPQIGEEEELAKQRRVISNTESILNSLFDALEHFKCKDGVEERLQRAAKVINRITSKAEGLLDDAALALDRTWNEALEAISILDKISSDLHSDSGRLEKVEERLFALRALARKHNVHVEGLPELRNKMRSLLDNSDETSTRLAELHSAEIEAKKKYINHAEKLTDLRCKAGMLLANGVNIELKAINMAHSNFTTVVTRCVEADWSAEGVDNVSFLVSTNPGTPLGSLNKVASGGELARIMLSIKAIMVKSDAGSVMVFDEVDSGVGGAVASAVGDRLLKIARNNQVLVITHSPQVAAKGMQHMLVSKIISKLGAVKHKKLETNIEVLNEPERIEEIARMISGKNITEEARAAANSLLLRS